MKMRTVLPMAAGLLAIAPVVPAMAQSAQMPTPPFVQKTHMHLEQLHSALHIRPHQERAFDRFATVAMRDAARTQHLFGQLGENIQHQSAAQDLRDFANVQMQVVGDFQRVVPAFDHLYAELSPRQREIADMAFRTVARRHEQRWASMANGQRWNNTGQQGWNNGWRQQGWAGTGQQGWYNAGRG